MKGFFRFSIVFIALGLFASKGNAQNPQILWQKAIGADSFEVGKCMIPLSDGTYILGGHSTGREGLGEGGHGNYDFCLLKVSAQGYPIWHRMYGGSKKEELNAVKSTPDGGFILMGTTESTDGDVEGNHGRMDMWLVKVDRLGNKEWAKCYGGMGNDKGYAVDVLPGEGYLIGGEGGSTNGDIGGTKGGLDGWMAVVDLTGNMVKKKNIGGHLSDKITHVMDIPKKGYLIVGETLSNDGDITRAYGQKDVMISLLSRNLDVIWQRNYGGSDYDEPHNIYRNRQGEILVLGTTFSDDEDLDLSHYHGTGDAWAFLITDKGNLAWSEAYGTAKSDGFSGAAQTEDGGYILVGTSNGYRNPDPSIVHMYDGFVMKIDSFGRGQWTALAGGENFESINEVQSLGEGRYLMFGTVESTKYDMAPLEKKEGSSDFWFFRFGDPGVQDVVLDTKPYLTGRVLDKDSHLPISADIVVYNNATLLEVGRTNSADRGYFFKNLPEKGRLSVNITAKGYMFYGQDIPPTEEANPEVRVDINLEPIRPGAKVTLNLIYFETGKWDLKPESDPELMRLKMFLKSNPNVTVEISGHTDNSGKESTKEELSLRRAESVRDWLLLAGINGDQMEVKGYGMTRPVADNGSEEGRAKNRRVEIEVLEVFGK